MTKSDKIREYFRKHPNADVAKVAARFEAPKPMTYKLRKQVQEWDQLITTSTPSGRKVTISASQLAIADKLGIDHNTFIEHALKAGVIQYDAPEADVNNLLYIDAPWSPPEMVPVPEVNALEVQVAGSHYKDMAIQPVEFVHANGIGYFEGNVIKYVTRWRNKNGIADLEKAKHYIELLIELETRGTK